MSILNAVTNRPLAMAAPAKPEHPAFEAGRTKKMSEFTDEQIVDIRDRIRIAVSTMLLQKFQFYGILALNLKTVFTDEIPTAATDGRAVYYNPAFVEKLSDKELIFLIVHELWHVLFEHFLRRGSRDPKMWNWAGDYVINYICKRDGIGKVIDGALLDDKYKDKTTEEVYEQLKEEGASGLQTLDVHLEIDGDGNMKAKDGNGNDISSEVFSAGGKPLTPEEMQDIKNKIQSAVIQAASSAPGSVPGEIKRMIDELLNPVIRWQDLLASTISAKFKHDTTFARPHKRSWSNTSGIIWPGDMPGEQINIAIAVDVSGSITPKMFQEFISEVYGIMTSYNEFKLRIWCFDTQVSGYMEYTEETRDDFMNFEMTGGGGTYIKSNFDFMEENHIHQDADLFVCFTDLYCGSLSQIDENLIDTLWIVNGSNQEPPFGDFAHYQGIED